MNKDELDRLSKIINDRAGDWIIEEEPTEVFVELTYSGGMKVTINLKAVTRFSPSEYGTKIWIDGQHPFVVEETYNKVRDLICGYSDEMFKTNADTTEE